MPLHKKMIAKASSNQIKRCIWHLGYTPSHVRAHALVTLGPSFLNSLDAYDISGYPLGMNGHETMELLVLCGALRRT